MDFCLEEWESLELINDDCIVLNVLNATEFCTLCCLCFAIIKITDNYLILFQSCIGKLLLKCEFNLLFLASLEIHELHGQQKLPGMTKFMGKSAILNRQHRICQWFRGISLEVDRNIPFFRMCESLNNLQRLLLQTGWLEQHKLIVSQFWRPEV